MDQSFYTAVSAARAQQTRLDILANNVANVNNEGYRAQNTSFADLIYQNIRQGIDVDQGVGVKVQRTDLDTTQGPIFASDGAYDYAIQGSGWFAVRDMATDEISYTRSGAFVLSEGPNGQFYLATPTGEQVLNRNMQPIVAGEDIAGDWQPDIGVFTFQRTEGFVALGNNLYRPGEGDGQPAPAEGSILKKGMLEASNVDLAQQFSYLIEAQRLYTMAARMVQNADEIESGINNLR